MLFAMASLFITSCTKEDIANEEIDPIEETEVEQLTDNPLVDDIEARSTGDGAELACFVIDYPFSLSVDGEISEIDSEEDLEAVFADLTGQEIVDFVYPFDITYEDGTTESIADAEALGEAFATCIPDHGWDPGSGGQDDCGFPAYLITQDEGCYDLVYPITLVDSDTGATTEVSNDEEFIAAITNTELILLFQFPLTLVDEDGVESTATDADGLFQLLVDCEYEGGGSVDTVISVGGDIACYDIEFPFTVSLVDGSEVEVADNDELLSLMLEGNVVSFVYPITLLDEEGETITVNSDEDLMEAFIDCGYGGTPLDIALPFLLSGDNAANDGFGCYDIIYPLTVVDDNETIELQSLDEAINITMESPLAELQFPVSVTNSDGEVVTIESLEELFSTLENLCG